VLTGETLHQPGMALRDVNRSGSIKRIWILGIPAAGAAAVLLAATPHGIGIYPDSVMYIMMARSLLQGQGWTMGGLPVELFPPLYPALLALGGLFGTDPADAARWIQAGIWGVNVFWAGFIAYRFSGESLAAALLCCAVTLGAVDLIAYQTVALSEGSYLFFLLPSLLLLKRYFDDGRKSDLVFAAALTALAGVTRYAGLAAIAGGVLSILLLEPKALTARIKNAALFGFVGASLPVGWMIRNLHYETPMGRRFDVHGFLGRQEVAGILNACAAWFLQWKIPDAWWMFILPPGFVLVLLFWTRSAVRHTPPAQSRLLILLWIYMAAYAALLVVSAAFFQADLFRDSSRILMPLHVLLLLVGVVSGYRWSMRADTPAIRVPLAFISFGAALLVLVSGVEYAKKVSGDAQGYASRPYRTSELIERSRSIPPGITVYTNLMLPVALYTGRITYRIPMKVTNSTQRENDTYDEEMRSMAGDIRDSSALLLYFNRTPKWFVLPTVDEIGHYVPLRCVAKEPDGAVYEAVQDTTEE
jgi:hypothetical protein